MALPVGVSVDNTQVLRNSSQITVVVGLINESNINQTVTVEIYEDESYKSTETLEIGSGGEIKTIRHVVPRGTESVRIAGTKVELD